MWLSENAAQKARKSGSDSEIGVVTVGGQSPSVMIEGEKRGLEIVSPGGIYWAPGRDEQVVVTRCGEELFVTGSLSPAPALSAGELCLKSGEAGIRLRPNGEIELYGTVNVKGMLLLNGVDIRSMFRLV